MYKANIKLAEQKAAVPQRQNEWINQSNTQKTLKPILEVKPSDIEYITFDTDWDGLKERLSEEFEVVITND